MRYLRLIFLLLLLPTFSYSQDWVVPENRKGRLSTFPFTDETRKAGEKLYTTNCMSCHGTPGKGNYLSLVPPPGDPATDKIQRNSDGEIYYKVYEGRGQMPSFRSVFSANDIWNIVSYIRSYNKNYVQKVMQVITSSAYPGAEIKLTLDYVAPDTSVVLKAVAVSEKETVAVKDAEVRLLIHRLFGFMQVDEVQVTDNQGVATFRIPADLPGDTAGAISFRAKFVNEDIFGDVSKDTILMAGIKTRPVSLIAERAMWNNVRKAPAWVLLAYSLGTLAVWGFILLVLLKLRDIYMIGKALTEPENSNK